MNAGSKTRGAGTRTKASEPRRERSKASRAPRLRASPEKSLATPGFIVTMDLRATSDPLWQNLQAFRMAMLERQWVDCIGVFALVRSLARGHGLSPTDEHASFIVMTQSELHHAETGEWLESQSARDKIVLFSGAAYGTTTEHDLSQPIDDWFRIFAIRWAESWMNARERQLAGTGEVLRQAEPAATGQIAPGADGDDEYRPATWFKKGMGQRLRKAASSQRKGKRVATQKIDGVVVYSVADARRWWPNDVPPNP